MKAITTKDTCYSTTATGNPLFNTDGKMRSSISYEEGRSALDFEIHKVQSYHFDEAAGEVEPIHNHFHLVRDTDGMIIDAPSVGAQFVPVQHRDVYDFIMNDIMPTTSEMKLEMVGTLHGLSTGIISVNFGDTFSIRGDKSPNAMRMIYANPCNGSGRLVMGFHMVRIVCQNTLALAIRQANDDGFRIKHTKGADINAKGALDQIKQASKSAMLLKERAEALSHRNVSVRHLHAVLEDIYPMNGLEEGSPAFRRVENLRQQVITQFESGSTAQTFSEKNAWMLFNSFSYPVINESRITVKTDRAQVAYQSMVGDVGATIRNIFATVETLTA